MRLAMPETIQGVPVGSITAFDINEPANKVMRRNNKHRDCLKLDQTCVFEFPGICTVWVEIHRQNQRQSQNSWLGSNLMGNRGKYRETDVTIARMIYGAFAAHDSYHVLLKSIFLRVGV